MRTPEQIKEFIFINHHLMTNQEMADELGVSYDWVAKICADNNLKPIKTKDRYVDFINNNKDLTIEQCAEVLGVHTEYVRILNKQLGGPLLSNKKKQLRDNPARKSAKQIEPVEYNKKFTKQEEDNLMNVLAEVVAGMSEKDRQRFAQKYIKQSSFL
jgi:hypothetical protein